jgi:manganese transport protein
VVIPAIWGSRGTGQLLILSQVILSMQLSFAVVPLVQFTSDRLKMGRFVNPRWLKVVAWAIAILIATLNAYLLVQTGFEWFAS